MQKLTKKEALSILPAVVDNEASQDEKEAFFAFIAENNEVQRQYKDALLMKRLLSEKLAIKPAPSHLKQAIQDTLRNLQTDEMYDISYDYRIDQPATDRAIRSTNEKKSSSHILRYLSAAAILLIFTLVTIQLLNNINPHTAGSTTQILENVSLEHFILSDGKFIEPHFSFSTTYEAEQFLAENHQLVITVPNIEGAEFAGIVLAEFTDSFHTPLLEYVQHDINETIYLFAFDMDEVGELNNLARNNLAAESCIDAEDFYITEIDNYHVVSWLWDNIWYTAVSNHNGYDLASLVEPLNYSNQ